MSEQDEDTLLEKVKYELHKHSYSPSITDLERDLWNDAHRPIIYLDDAARAALIFARSYANKARTDELSRVRDMLGISSHPQEGLIVYPRVVERIAELESGDAA